MARRLGTDGGGELRKPLADGSNVVVDDVVDTGAPLDRGRRRRDRVVDVDERPHAGPVADDREPLPPHQLDHVAVVVGGLELVVEATQASTRAGQGGELVDDDMGTGGDDGLGDHVTRIWSVVNPDKLRHLAPRFGGEGE